MFPFSVFFDQVEEHHPSPVSATAERAACMTANRTGAAGYSVTSTAAG